MNEQYLKLLKETFKDITHLNPEKVRHLIDETTVFFTELQEKFKSDEEGARKEAEAAAVSVKEFLEEQMEKVVQSSGFDPEEFLSSITDLSKLSQEDRELLNEIQEKLQAVHGTLPKKKKKKGKKTRLLG